MSKIIIHFLGTNGWYDTETGNTICTLIQTGQEHIILDAGNGIYKVDQFIKDNKPVYLFLSHFHLDHIFGLHTLAKFKFPGGLIVCLPKGMTRLFKTIVSKTHTVAWDKLPYKVAILEYKKHQAKLPFLESALQLRHPVPCFGFRFNLDGKVISYVADTGDCENAYKLAKEADLVISECAYKTGQVVEGWPHLTPALGAEIAKKSKAKQLVLTHFDAEVYRSLKERAEAQVEAKQIFPNTIVATDGLKLEV